MASGSALRPRERRDTSRSVGLARHGFPADGSLRRLDGRRRGAVLLVHGARSRRAHPLVHAVGALGAALLGARAGRLRALAGRGLWPAVVRAHRPAAGRLRSAGAGGHHRSGGRLRPPLISRAVVGAVAGILGLWTSARAGDALGVDGRTASGSTLGRARLRGAGRQARARDNTLLGSGESDAESL